MVEIEEFEDEIRIHLGDVGQYERTKMILPISRDSVDSFRERLRAEDTDLALDPETRREILDEL